MRRNGFAILVALAVVCFAVPASAQEREPAAGAVALGAEVGFFVPIKGMEVGASFGAQAEFYLFPRFSVRVGGGTAATGFNDSTEGLRRSWAAGNLVYNWEADLWHPYITAGVGGYWSHVGRASQETKIGVNGGVGIEYFWRPKITVKLEALYHFVDDTGLGTDPSGATLTVGIKRYF